MRLELTTAPTVEPITQEEMENQLNLSHGYDTDKINGLITAAREIVETDTDRSFINQTWTMHLDGFKDVIYLPKGKVQSITSFSYISTDDVLTALVEGTDYYLSSVGSEARLIPLTSFPNTHAVKKETVQIVWVSGEGATASYVNYWCKEAIKVKGTMLYDLGNDMNEVYFWLTNRKKLYFDYRKNG
jgi:uncharacterized phiE125 gp8 family phage protein